MTMLMNRLALCAGASVLAGSIASAEPTLVVPSAGVHRDVTRNLSVSDFSLQRTSVDGNLGERIAFELDIEGMTQQFSLTPFSLRGENFRVLTQVASGALVEVEAPAPRTYRGANADGSMVIVGSLLDEGFKGQIISTDDDNARAWGVQPLSDVMPGSDAGLYVTYDTTDTMPTGHSCGGALVGDELLDGFDPRIEAGGGAPRGGQLLACELIIDADFQFYSIDNGSSLSGTIADVENVMAGVDTVYVRDVNVTFILNDIVVRTSSGTNPYTTNNASALLDQVRSAWFSTGADRDLVHMFTGRNLSGSTIGIAWLSAVCSNNLGYGLSESRFSGNINSRVALTAHEIGHNFSAQHCSGGSCYIMCAGLGGCGGISPPGVTGPGFGNSSINAISNFAQSRPCIETAGPPFLDWPFFQDFASTTLDADVWQSINGAIVNQGAANEPSAPNSLNLDFSDTIETGRFDLSDDTGETLLISMYTQRRGVEAGESLFLEYFTIAETWQTLAEFTSDGSTQDEFEYQQVVIPILALWSEVKFRLRTSGDAGNDDWYIDDFSIDTYQGLTPPFADDFESGLDTSFTYETNSGGIISTGADNEPSGSNSLNLDNADSIATFNINMSGLFDPGYYVRFYSQHKGTEAGEDLVVEYRDLGDNWQPLTTVPSDGTDQTEFDLHQIALPIIAYQSNFAVRFTATGNAGNDDWYIDDLAVTEEFIVDEPDEGCNGADIAEPFDVLDFSDVVSFLSGFGTCEPEADLAAPFGSCDFSDVVEFLSLFGGGCP